MTTSSPTPPPGPEREETLTTIRYILALLWLLLVAALTLLLFMPFALGHDQIHLPFGLELDELLHVAFFAAISWVPPLVVRSRSVLGLVILCLVLLGVFSEIFQLGIPHRRFSEVDLAANMLGCAAGTMAGLVLRRLVFKRMLRRNKQSRDEAG